MRQLSLHVTDRCNQRCCFCLFDDLSRGAERIPMASLEGFLEANRGLGFERVNLHGGEPTVRGDLIGLVEKIRALGYPEVSLQTNGCRLADASYAARLAGAGVSLFIVSLHAADEETHDRLVGVPGRLRLVVQGLQNVLALGVAVRTNTVVTRRNYRVLSATAHLLLEIGVQHVNISSLMPSGMASVSFHELMPSYTEISGSLEEALFHLESRGARVTLEGFPLCVLPAAHRKRVVLRLAAAGDVIKCLVRGRVIESHDEYAIEHCRCKRRECEACADSARCPGAYRAYADVFGWDEFQPTRSGLEARP
jgi:molybdenum cofactor biosynthesis enzyme MoaA